MRMIDELKIKNTQLEKDMAYLKVIVNSIQNTLKENNDKKILDDMMEIQNKFNEKEIECNSLNTENKEIKTKMEELNSNLSSFKVLKNLIIERTRQ